MKELALEKSDWETYSKIYVKFWDMYDQVVDKSEIEPQGKKSGLNNQLTEPRSGARGLSGQRH